MRTNTDQYSLPHQDGEWDGGVMHTDPMMSIHIMGSVLHYGQVLASHFSIFARDETYFPMVYVCVCVWKALFEGLKAFHCADGKVTSHSYNVVYVFFQICTQLPWKTETTLCLRVLSVVVRFLVVCNGSVSLAQVRVFNSDANHNRLSNGAPPADPMRKNTTSAVETLNLTVKRIPRRRGPAPDAGDS